MPEWNDLNLQQYIQRRRRMIDRALERWVPGQHEFPPQIHQAMRYSLFAGGKRIRPILALAAAEAVGGRAALVQVAVRRIGASRFSNCCASTNGSSDSDQSRRR